MSGVTSGIGSEPAAGPAIASDTPNSDRAQIRNCVSPAPPTPRSFPARSVEGPMPEPITSTTRLVFSSMVEVMTTWPHMMMLV